MSYLPNPSRELVVRFGRACNVTWDRSEGPFFGSARTMDVEAPHLFELIKDLVTVPGPEAAAHRAGMLVVWALLRFQAEIDAGVREPDSIS